MDKIKLIGKFIGSRRIVNLRSAERKTFLGRDVIEIEFADNAKEEYPVDTLEAIATEKAIDLTALRQLEIAPVATKILGILTDSELPIFDPSGANIQYLLQSVLPDSIQENTRKAYGQLFNKDYCKINLADLDKVLKINGGYSKNKQKINRDGTPS